LAKLGATLVPPRPNMAYFCHSSGVPALFRALLGFLGLFWLCWAFSGLQKIANVRRSDLFFSNIPFIFQIIILIICSSSILFNWNTYITFKFVLRELGFEPKYHTHDA
jgi:hypothetical protein